MFVLSMKPKDTFGCKVFQHIFRFSALSRMKKSESVNFEKKSSFWVSWVLNVTFSLFCFRVF